MKAGRKYRICLVAPAVSIDRIQGGQEKSASVLWQKLSRSEQLSAHLVCSPSRTSSVASNMIERIRFYIKFIKLVFSTELDAVHYFTPCTRLGYLERSVLSVISRSFGTKQVLNFRNDPRVFYSRLGYLYRKYFSLSLRIYDLAICQFSDLESFLRQNGWQESKPLVTIPNMIEREFPSNVLPCTRWDGKRLLFIGSIEPRKGILELIDVLDLIRDQIPSVSLKIVGPVICESTYKEVLKKSRERSLEKFVHITGHLNRTQIFQTIDESCLLVLPSSMEGFPNVILEALCMGVPVVMTRAGAANDLEKVTAQAVTVVPVGGVAELAAEIVSLLTDQERYLVAGAEAISSIVRYSPEEISARFEFAYKLAVDSN